MKKVYLKNGEEVILHETLLSEVSSENSYIIERIYVYEDYNGDSYEDGRGVKEIVNEIFTTAPIEKIEESYKKQLELANELTETVGRLYDGINSSKRELVKIEKNKTDISKLIINRSDLLNAKRLTVFTDFRPISFDGVRAGERRTGLRLTIGVNLYTGEESTWACEISEDDGYQSSKKVNPLAGIMVDATDNEILEMGKKIVAETEKISDWDLTRIPVEYLTAELIARRELLINKANEASIAEYQKKIDGYQASINKLLSE